MYNLVILKKEIKTDQTNFLRNFDKMYPNALVKKIMISDNFYKNNIDLF